ncbi:MAG: Stp1/IreP family PP2C-type Ser/Thr phosphatase [Bacillota bacterium]
MHVIGQTDPGRERSRNEDSFLVRTDGAIALFAVADGMGGHVAGDVASAIAIAVLEKSWPALKRGSLPGDGQFAGIVQKMICEANKLILAESAGESGKQGMGTTLTMGLLNGCRLTIGHVGDSRAYLISDSAITLLTADHSLLEQLIQQGSISAAEAQGHPQRHILTRALGTGPAVEIDLIERELTEDYRVLLCSDGLTTMVQDQEIWQIVLAKETSGEAVESLIQLANDRGGHDNITVVLAAGIGRQAV